MTSLWPRWRLKSPASRLFTQPFIQTQIKENINAPRHWPLCGEFTGTGEFPAQRASYAENVSIWWRHHATTPEHWIQCETPGELWSSTTLEWCPWVSEHLNSTGHSTFLQKFVPVNNKEIVKFSHNRSVIWKECPCHDVSMSKSLNNLAYIDG